jgi:lipopolysaccharide/colanic/teichoic acid biosynthesis glycosyltransferase
MVQGLGQSVRKALAIPVWPAGPRVRRGHATACAHAGGWRKRAFDLTLALALLILAAPVLALAVVAIRLDTPGPALFQQTRVGWQGRRFRILKLRTLYWRTGGGQVAPGDPRITRVGRWLRRTSLDELPQLVNVLRGEMSLVGPRPHALRDDLRFARLHPAYKARRQVRPGLTGPAQVDGCRGPVRRPDELYRRTRHDLSYVAGRSVAGDLMILLRTVKVVLRGAAPVQPRD